MTISSDEASIEIEKLRLVNNQAAEYGLKLLHEKTVLETQYEELEDQNELLKLELRQLEDQLKIIQINKCNEIFKVETNEENFLNEKQTREEDLIKEIKYHEQELRSLKQENENLHKENKNILSNSQQLIEQIQELDELNTKLKYDLQESINEEQRLIVANTELVEENVVLQQQVEKLRKNLIDYDGLKVENKQLQENVG